MPWDKTNRAKYDYKTDRYPSDMTNAQWAVIEPLVPLPKHGGRRRTTDMREVINAIFYIARTGCQWRLLPQPFPPWTTVQRYFYEWTRTGVLAEMNGNYIFEWHFVCKALLIDCFIVIILLIFIGCASVAKSAAFT